MIVLGGCGNKALEEATYAVEEYNEEVSDYNKRVVSYNEAVNAFNQANYNLQEIADNAQEVLDKGEIPFDSETIIILQNALNSTLDAKVDNLGNMDELEQISIDEEMDKVELKEFTERVISDTAKIKNLNVPDNPIPMDYSVVLSELEEGIDLYKKSVQSMNQVTAPSDEFIISRLQMVDTIEDIAAVTAEHDPNGMLNTQGGYIGCIYFIDSHVSNENLHVEKDSNAVIDIGTIGGGCVEVYSNVEDAENRDILLASYDGTVYYTGSHCIIGTCVIRASKELTDAQQKELTNAIIEKLIMIQ